MVKSVDEELGNEVNIRMLRCTNIRVFIIVEKIKQQKLQLKGNDTVPECYFPKSQEKSKIIFQHVVLPI